MQDDHTPADDGRDVLNDDALEAIDALETSDEAPADEAPANEAPAAVYADEAHADEGVLDDALAGEDDAPGAGAFHEALASLDEADEDAEDDDDAEAEDVDAEDAAENADDDEADEADDEAEADDDEAEDVADAVAAYQQQAREQLREAGIQLGDDQDLTAFVLEEVQANEQLVGLYQQQPELLRLTQQMMQGKTLHEAMIELELDVDPDDPAVIRAQARREAQQEARDKQIKAAADKAASDRQTFQAAHELSDDEMQGLMGEIGKYIYGDPTTGALPSDFLEVMYRGLRYDEDVASARETAKLEGKNEAVTQVRNKRKQKGDGVPFGRSGSANLERTPREASLEDLASQLSGGDVLDDFI